MDIIKVNKTFYLHRNLIDFIESLLDKDDELKEGDKIFFFPTVDFRRDKLAVSATKFNRVITTAAADAVVLPNLHLQKRFAYSIDNQTKEMIKDPDGSYFTYLMRSSMITDKVLSLLHELYINKYSRKIVKQENLRKYINSGIVINDENFTFFQNLCVSDPNLFLNYLQNMDLSNARWYLYTIRYFHQVGRDMLADLKFGAVRGATGPVSKTNTELAMNSSPLLYSVIADAQTKRLLEIINSDSYLTLNFNVQLY